MLCVEMPNAGMCFYTGVHQRLRVTRLVAFVMSKATEPDKVENNVLVELMSVRHRDLDHAICSLGRITVDVKDRRLRDLCRVGRVDRATAQFGGRRKTDLIIDDDVDRPTCTVTGKICEL